MAYGKNRSFIKNFLVVTLATIFLRISTAITSILLTRWLPIEEYGYFSYGQSIMLLTLFGVSAGLPTCIMRMFSQEPDCIGRILLPSIQLITILALLECSVIAFIFYINLMPSQLTIIVVPMALSGAFFAGNMVIQSYFRTIDRYYLQAGLIIFQALFMAFSLLLIALKGYGAYELALMLLIVTAVIFIIHLAITFHLFGLPKISEISSVQLLSKTIPFGLMDWILAAFPLIIGTGLVLQSTAEDVAIFYVSVAILGALWSIIMIADQLFLREIIRRNEIEKLHVIYIYIMVSMFGGGICIILFYHVSNLLSGVFFKETHQELIVILEMLGFIVLFRAINMACTSYNRIESNYTSVLQGYVIAFVVLLAVIPFVSSWGAVIAMQTLMFIEAGLAVIFLCQFLLFSRSRVLSANG